MANSGNFDLKDFLFGFFAQRHFDIMPADVRARFDDYRANNDFNGHMKNWTTQFMDTDGTSLPLPELNNKEDVIALYNLCQAVFQKMAANYDDFKDIPPVNKFYKKWFGEGKIFNYSQATDDAKSDINAIKGLIERNKSRLNVFLKHNQALSDTFSIDNLLDGIKTEKYDKDPDFRSSMLYVVDTILTYQDRDEWPIEEKVNLKQPDPEQWFQVDTSTVQNFRTGDVNDETGYIDLLKTLVSSKVIRDNFTKYDSKGVITEQLNKALKETGYDDPDSKDFVPPKVKEAKNIIDKIKDWKEETYEQYFRKFFSSRGSRKYFSVYAYEIVKAIDKEKIKPTDGIDGILNKKDALLKRFGDKSQTAKKHFEWFEKAMTEVKKRVPHSYENAFKDGIKLKQVVSQVIIKAVADDEIEKAKTTLELLSVCKYGFTTSKTMDDLKNQHVTIFSDKGLSWNNNKAANFISNVFDRTLEASIKAVGRGAAMFRNIHQQRLSKFNGEQGELAPHINAKKQEKQSIIIEQRNNATRLKDANNKDLANLAASGGVSHEHITQTNLNNLKTECTNRQQILRQREATYNAASSDIQLLKNKTKYDNILKAVQVQEAKRSSLYNELSAMTEGTQEYNEKSQQILAIEQEIYAKQQSIAPFEHIFAHPTPETTARLTTAQQISDDYDAAKSAYETLDQDIKNYENLTTENATLTQQIDEYDDRIRNWDNKEVDNYRNLMAYWDILQTFSKTHSFERATLKMQERNLERITNNINGDEITKTAAQWGIEQEIANYRYHR